LLPHLIVGADINNVGDGEEKKHDKNIERTPPGKSSGAQQSRRDLTSIAPGETGGKKENPKWRATGKIGSGFRLSGPNRRPASGR